VYVDHFCYFSADHRLLSNSTLLAAQKFSEAEEFGYFKEKLQKAHSENQIAYLVYSRLEPGPVSERALLIRTNHAIRNIGKATLIKQYPLMEWSGGLNLIRLFFWTYDKPYS